MVQGVGFRPAVHRLATALGLTGTVRNGPDGAVVEIEGPAERVHGFGARLAAALPPLARLEAVEESALVPMHAEGFVVGASVEGRRARALVPPDARTCPRCEAERRDPGDRRFAYPFTTCTDCGPRFTLVRRLPYDRERTSMDGFTMCPACASEYEDPASRRFHAETQCCPVCGPLVTLRDGSGSPLAEADAALARARALLADGGILALHGLGGFQLLCRADDDAAIATLRRRKRRASKPFAVMVRDLAVARATCRLGADDEALLRGPRGPILLAPRQPGARVGAAVAPGLGDLGLLLPTTPLHAELFRDAPYEALVATSGNRSEEPIRRTADEALAGLTDLVDAFLVHDREVLRRNDDSVLRSRAGGALFVRRSRGWVPEPVRLPVPSPEPILALGAQLQTTACLVVGDRAFPSQHVGDLDSEPARAFLREVAEGLEDFLEVRARVLAVDAHPDLPSRWLGEVLAAERDGRVLPLQHHLAHAAAVLGEHDRFPAPGEVAGAIVLDGTGLGNDGSAWGAEWLCIDGALGWSRPGTILPLPLVGGEQAVREPWRVAVTALTLAGEETMLPRLPLATLVPRERVEAVARLAERPHWTLAHGAGRLFEAAGALAGLCAVNGYEGEAAARFEALAARADGRGDGRCALDGDGRSKDGDGGEPDDWSEQRLVHDRIDAAALLLGLAHRLADGQPAARTALGFHRSFCRLAADLATSVFAGRTGLVALGGGCLVNRLLYDGLADALATRGFEVLRPRALPPGDGGLAYGQAVLAAVALARGVVPELRRGA